ncbi:hypothetical protein BU15DRAFT_66376 [Melanogaster broomeanus]|nr:hypothetical protein BU15DRAFT_66376 [Melanogaster broomeanus]
MVDFSISELRILQSYKNSWKAGRHKQSKHHVYQQVVQAAHKLPETQGMSKQAWTERKKDYHHWLRNFGRTRKPKELTKYGKSWTARRVIGEKYRPEVNDIAKKVWDADPGSKAFLECYQKSLTKVVEQRSKEELEEAEDLANQWNTGMLPAKLRARNGDDLGQKYAHQFSQQMWRQCGTRVVILAAWKDGSDELCYTTHDFNETIGGIPFQGLADGGMETIEKAWMDYAKDAFGDQDGKVAEDEQIQCPRGKKLRGPTKVTHLKDGVPYLPDIREVGLDEGKSLVREFITGYYRIACGKKNAAVPWAKIISNPDGLLHRKYLPAGVYLKEPSKLKKLEVDKLLDFWKNRADRGIVPVFAFHRWMNWQGELMEPVETEVDGWGDSPAGDGNESANEAAADQERDADDESHADEEPAGDGNDSADEATADGEPHSGDDSDVPANLQPVRRSTPYPTKLTSTATVNPP